MYLSLFSSPLLTRLWSAVGCVRIGVMDWNDFIRAREGRWRQLDGLLTQVEKASLAKLSVREAELLFELYRLTSSDLNLVQTRTGRADLLDYLEQLVGRGYACLTPMRRANLLGAWWRIMRHDFPRTIRQQWRIFLLATVIMLGGAALGAVATALEPAMAGIFLPPEHLDQSAAERVAALEELERSGASQVNTTGQHAVFSTFLFTHNIRVSVLCFALGLTLGIGTVALVFFNGAMLGALAWRYWQDGVFTFFIAWVGPHGSVELPCVLFAATAGLLMARCMWRRDGQSIRTKLLAIRSELVTLVVGSATLLVLAGLVEGGFSQVNEPTLPYPFKIFVAGMLFSLLLAYLFALPVGPAQEATGAELELAPEVRAAV